MTLTYPPFLSNPRIQRAATNRPSLRQSDPDVKAVQILQQALIDVGFPLPISTNFGLKAPDGKFSNETLAAVNGFQIREGLKIDGIAGREVIERLDRLLNSGGLPPNPSPPNKKKLLTELMPDVGWQVWNDSYFQMLVHPANAHINWELGFGGATQRPLTDYTYKCAKELKTPHVAFVVPTDCMAPKAYLLYLHHSTNDEYTEPDYLLKGIGDVLYGRQNVVAQVSQSNKDVAIVVPEPRGQSLGIFNTDPDLLLATLKEFDEMYTKTVRDLPPLLIVTYSDGIGQAIRFEQACSKLLPRVKAVYDLDGAWVVRFRHYNYAGFIRAGAKVFRYIGMAPGKLSPNEPNQVYLQRLAGRAPSMIACPKARWNKHQMFTWHHPSGDGEWLHYMIPTCMLSHGLVMTDI